MCVWGVASRWFWFSPSPRDINFGCTGENENAFQYEMTRGRIIVVKALANGDSAKE